MSFVDKEKELLFKMEEDGYKTLFNGNKEEALHYVSAHFSSVTSYVTGSAQNNVNSLLQGEGSSREGAMRNGDALYDKAANGITALNRLSNMLGMGNVFDVDLEDTAATKKFLGDSVMEIFWNAIADTDME